MNPHPSPPQSEDQLLARAADLCGQNFAQLAHIAGISVPADLRRDKGWVGQLLEWHLGASAGSRPEPDFPHLGIELKTLPMGYQGQPLETTFVCVAPLTGITNVTWQQCHLRHKLARVLWLPIEGERDIPLAQRRVGPAILWSPNAQEEAQLKADWEELMESIALGESQHISASRGEVLQLRPKAAHGQVKTRAFDSEGNAIQAQPKGFYLKKSFTGAIIARHFSVDQSN
ncbi:DNA mismatch repair protein MutH [Vibrio stylophorae]|uniref:DNA mismatch repair protein MutH n=1 Tax=Vibrio stylophorae TaxID=659351 RepID=A0ABM8ZQX5_9VIBR|nr:DNA mismatch repair endonuclease MutH [Vibrio stylophorae]CAH0532684.1 DNA mismatch repair protein MutH [Vibrio stylophorae]